MSKGFVRYCFLFVVLACFNARAEVVSNVNQTLNYVSSNSPMWRIENASRTFDKVSGTATRGEENNPASSIEIYGVIYKILRNGVTSITDSVFNNTYLNTNVSNSDEGANGGIAYLQRLNLSSPAAKISLIDNTTFNNNTLISVNTKAYGGVIANEGNITKISNSEFKNNYISSGNSYAHGGAIANGMYRAEQNEANVNPKIDIIENTEFEGNYAKNNGGAIYNSANATIESIVDSSFKSNSAVNGGAIYNNGTISEIKNVTFENNKATYGGAIYHNSANALTLTNVSFKENEVANSGAAIWGENSDGSINLRADNGNSMLFDKNLSWTSNSNYTQYLAIWTRGDINIDAKDGANVSFNDSIGGSAYDINIGKNSTYSDSTGVVKLNAPLWDNPTVNMDTITLKLGTDVFYYVKNANNKTTVNFKPTSGVVDVSWDDEIKDYQLGNLTPNTNVMYDIDVSSSGADGLVLRGVDTEGVVTLGNVDILSEGVAGTFQILKGAINNLNLALTDSVKKIGNNVSSVMSSDSFVGNIVELAKSSGSAVYDSIKVSLIDPLKAWAEYDTTSDKTFSVNADMTLLEGITSISGSKILLTGDNSAQKRTLNVNSVNFLSNQAKYKDITLRDLIITNMGSRIYNDGKLTLSNVEFRNNDSGSNAGGVIYNYGGAGLSISDSVFDGNIGGSYGGVICNTGYGYISSINNSTFSNNSAVYGGAIENGNRVIDSINGVNFVENTATEGGAIKNTGTINNIINTEFSKNVAQFGGAIYNAGGSLNLVNVSMVDNKAMGTGAAIYNSTTNAINIRADGTGKETTVSGNISGYNSSSLGNVAIYTKGNINIDAKNNAKVVIKDDIDGENFDINIGNDTQNSDNTGVVELMGKLSNVNSVNLYNVALKFGMDVFKDTSTLLKVNSGEVNMVDGVATEYNVGKLQSSENASWNLDIKLDNNGDVVADTIYLGTQSEGVVNLKGLNIADMNPVDDSVVKIQILKGEVGSAELVIDGQVKLIDKAVAKMSTSDVLAKSFGLAKTGNTYDSIEIAGARNVLAAWAELDTSLDKVFTLNESLTATRDTNGLIGDNISLVSSGGFKELDLNGFDMLSNINETQNVTIDNIKIVNAKNNLITNAGSLVLENSAEIGSNLINNNSLTLNDTTKISGEVVNNGLLKLEDSAVISALVTNNNEAILDDEAKVSAGIVNNGYLKLTENSVVLGGLTNNEAISRASNVIDIKDEVVVSGGLVNNDIVNVSDKAQINGDVINNGILNINDNAVLYNALTNTGNINVADSSYILGDIVNNGEGALNANLWSLDGNIENNATFNILGGSLTKNITGDGVNIIKDDVTLEGGNFSENSDLEVVSGAELNIGDTEVVVDNANIKGQVALKVTQIKAYDSEYKGGRILVNNADIEGGKVKFTVDAGQLSGRQVTGDLEIVSLREGASGKIVGDYSSLFEENNRYVIEQGSKKGSVVIRNTNSASDVVINSGIGNRNNANTAQAWDTALLNEGRAKEMQDVLNELSQHNKLGYIKALNGVAPSDNQLALNNSRQINNILSREVMRHYEEDGCSCGSPFKRVSSWVQTIGAYSKQDTRVTSTGYSAQTTGLVLGFDSVIDCDTKVGFGYANYRTDADSSYRDTEINGHSLFAYAKYQPSFWYARGLISYSMQDFNERSNVEGVLINTDYDGNAFGVESALGYEYLNGITPEVGVKYIYVTSDDYIDSLGQSVDTEGVDVLTLEARVKYEPRWGLDDEYDIRPRAYVGVGYDVVNGKRTTDVSLSDVKYDVFAKDMPRLGFEAGVALEGSVGDLDVSVGYDVDFRKDYQDHTGMIKLRYNF